MPGGGLVIYWCSYAAFTCLVFFTPFVNTTEADSYTSCWRLINAASAISTHQKGISFTFKLRSNNHPSEIAAITTDPTPKTMRV